MRTRNVVLVCLVLAFALGLAWSGPVLYRSIVGIDASGYPLGNSIQAAADAVAGPFSRSVAGIVLSIGALVLFALVSFFLTRSAARGNAVEPGRRGFLAGAAAGLGALVVGGAATVARMGFGLGAGGRGWANVTGPAIGVDTADVWTHPEWRGAWKGARITRYRPLGDTGALVSDISLGSSGLPRDPAQAEAIVRGAVERGVSYLDTAPDYSEFGSEEAIGRATAGVPRDRLFLATKFCTRIGHLPVGTPVARYKEVVEGSLQRLRTDYVDLVHIHSCDSVERLLDPGAHEAFDQLRQEGKVRFLGFSSHTPNLETVAEAAIESGRFQVMMPAYHFGAWKDLGPIMRRARESGMGVVAMKTLKGAKHHGLSGFREQADAFSQAAFSWVLSNDDVSCLVVSFRTLQHVDEYVYASGRPLASDDLALLEEYDRQIAGSHCAPHCGECLDSCPERLPIADVLRYRMYAEDYGQEREGMRLYGKLERSASVCASCSAPCLGSCPLGIPIQQRMSEAHELLSLS
jgi:predicted aldo/keto reductase-like oxidoreductase